MKNSDQSAPDLKSMSWGQRERYSWTYNIGKDIGGGIVATFCLLPEVMGFMLSIGVPPFLGLFTCVVLTVTLAITGGRPGVITACAGATATICAGMIAKFCWGPEVVAQHTEYLFAAVLFAGIIQIILGLVKFGNLIKFIPDCVMHGFVNGLASLILIAQIKMILREDVPVDMTHLLIVLAAGIGLIVLFDKIKKAVKGGFIQYIPSPMICVIAVSIYVWVSQGFGSLGGGQPGLMRIVDLGQVAFSTEYFFSVFKNFGNVFTAEGMGAIIPVALSVAFIGLVETMLTSRVVSEKTETPELTNLNRECRGQGIGNIICAVLGTMPGCAMIAPSNANVNSGGKGRVSTLMTGIMMAVLLFGISPVLSAIPLAALIAVMLYVCFETYNWDSIVKCFKHPIIETVTMLLVVVIVLGTDNLAYGVGFGMVAWGVFMLFKFFMSANKAIGLSFILFGVSMAICWFGGVLAVSFLMSAIGVGLGSIARNAESTKYKIGTFAIVLNSCAFAWFVFMVILNTHILPHAFPWFSLH